jgi:UDP-glucose 4-epimerase
VVLYAFQNGSPGDIFVQKAPAVTILTLAEALKELFRANNEIQILGTRHGEKLYETLLNREETAKAEDRGAYYRIPADVRDLNYSLYFSEGQLGVSFANEYTSHNTHRMDRAEMIELLLKLDCVRDVLKTRTGTV